MAGSPSYSPNALLEFWDRFAETHGKGGSTLSAVSAFRPRLRFVSEVEPLSRGDARPIAAPRSTQPIPIFSRGNARF